MNDTLHADHTVQSGRIIERTDDARPLFYSAKIGRDFASPAGGWTHERDKATVLSSYAAKQLLAGALMSVAPSCLVVSP